MSAAAAKPNQTLLVPRLLRSIQSKPAAGGSPPPAGPILDLTDTERLFAPAATSDLVRSLAMMYAMAVEPAVDLGMAVLRRPGVMRSPAVKAAVRGTVYRQFCAGEGVEEAAETLRRLWKEGGLRGILDYGLEDAVDEEACDRNLKGFLKTVDLTAKLPANSVSFACVKITAICPINLLKHISDLLRWQKKHPNSFTHFPWKLPSLPILTNSSPLYHTPTIPPPLTPAEESQLRLAHSRLSTLCARCADANLPLLVDAEYTSVQPAIDHIVYAAARQFNSGEKPLVYNTMQSYLRDAKERLVEAMEGAELAGISMGFKLVRGAYLSRESKVAAEMGGESPIHESIGETHDCYNDCAGYMIERMVVKGSAACLLATHNLESGKAAAAKAEEMGIAKGDERLQFAQLMGMADGLSLGLRNAGFHVSKYLPFGPVDQVIPYLMRRAEENRGFLSTSTLDRDLIRKELKRRLRAAVQIK